MPSGWSWGFDNGTTGTNALWVASGQATATPVLGPENGSYYVLTAPQAVTLSCSTPATAVIHYTLDGTDPTAASASYSGPITIDHSLTLKAQAYADGYAPGGIKSVTFVLPTSYNRPASIPHGSAVVDGDLSDWSSATWTPLDKAYYPDNVTWPADVTSASYAVRWSANKVYVAVKVQDTNHVLSSTHTAWNGQDAVEFYLHTTNSSPTAGYNGNFANAQMYWMGVGPDNVTTWASLGYNALTSPAGLLAASSVNGDWLMYEAALIPYQSFDNTSNTGTISTLSGGNVIGLDVVVSAKSTGFGQIAENSVTGKSSDYSTFGLHRLVYTAGDLTALLAAMDTYRDVDAGYNPAADLDGDGEITSTDLAILLANME